MLDKEEVKKICKRVKDIRVGLGLTAREMSKRLDIPYQTYRGHEKNLISVETLIGLNKLIGVSIDYLLGVKDFDKSVLSNTMYKELKTDMSNLIKKYDLKDSPPK